MTYPVGPQLHSVWITIRMFAKGRVCHTPSKSIAVLDNHKVIDGRVGQSLLQTA